MSDEYELLIICLRINNRSPSS